MNEFRWFRLLLFTLGLYFAASAAFEILYYVGVAIQQLVSYSRFSTQGESFRILTGSFIGSIPYVLKGVFGIYLIRGGGVIKSWMLRRMGQNCAKCDYGLVGVKGNKCPECGLEFDPSLIYAKQSE